MIKRLRLGVLGLGSSILLAACGGGAASSSPPAASAAASKPAAAPVSASAVPSAKPAASAPTSASPKPAASAATSTAPKPAASGPAAAITLALGYIPNIQFAPFYVAQAKGFYKDEGIDISFDNGISPDMVKSVGAGKFKFAIADPDTVISAREQSIPVTYLAGLYAQAPVSVISLPAKSIRSPQDLKGKKVGLPGRYGSSYIGLLGVLNKAGLTEKDIDLQEIGFNQAPQLLAGKVDAVLGYANNDAIQVQAQSGSKPNVILIADVIPFIGTGLIANEDTLKGSDRLVQGMVRAMLRGMQDTAAHPDDAFQATVKVVPEAGGQNAKLNQDVLAASLPLWKDKGTEANGLGFTDPVSWKAMEDVMVKAGIAKAAPPVDQVVTNKYVSKDIK
jgi:NitT/TauT family transport system substrate-binding protein